jgi:glucose-1-phosphate cytidylyltransferase
LIKLGKLRAHPHNSFWAAMDTLYDKVAFDEAEASGMAPWMIWNHGDGA